MRIILSFILLLLPVLTFAVVPVDKMEGKVDYYPSGYVKEYSSYRGDVLVYSFSYHDKGILEKCVYYNDLSKFKYRHGLERVAGRIFFKPQMVNQANFTIYFNTDGYVQRAKFYTWSKYAKIKETIIYDPSGNVIGYNCYEGKCLAKNTGKQWSCSSALDCAKRSKELGYMYPYEDIKTALQKCTGSTTMQEVYQRR